MAPAQAIVQVFEYVEPSLPQIGSYLRERVHDISPLAGLLAGIVEPCDILTGIRSDV